MSWTDKKSPWPDLLIDVAMVVIIALVLTLFFVVAMTK